MKRHYWIMAAWLATMILLLGLGFYFAAHLVNHIRQGTLQYWEPEFVRFIGLCFLVVLISGGFYQELRHSSKS